MRELSPSALLLGLVVAVCMGAANAYVGLKVGMTVNASIPAAVIALVFFRGVLKRAATLESNMVQTIGSAGQSIAGGMIFTMPALIIMGYMPSLTEMVIWGAIGGLLGVCFMVPLRRLLIVQEAGNLPYPEGVACAKVLQAGGNGRGARAVVDGALVGGVFSLITGLGFWAEEARTPVPDLMKTQGALSVEPALLGVGYIIGPRISAVMLSGAGLAWFVVIPAIGFFGAGAAEVMFPASKVPIAGMTPRDIHESYIKYIGAGAVTVGGLLALLHGIPTIASSFWQVLRGVFHRLGRSGLRTDRDIPAPLLLLVIAGLGYAMWRFPQVRVNHIGAIAILVFALFFVTVSSRIVGLIGTSSNPASGMTIAALLGTCLAFKYLMPSDLVDLMPVKIACLSVGAIVCCSIVIAGDISQDLKTGNLVGATPWKQQVGEILAVLVAVVANASVILLLARAKGFVLTAEHPDPLPAPQANIMRILVDGAFGGGLPWELLIMGGALALVLAMLRVPVLPFAVGFYLPLALSAPIMVGGIARWFVERRRVEHEEDPGMLAASGLVAGNGLMGIALIGATVALGDTSRAIPWLWARINMPSNWGLSETGWNLLPLAPFLIVVVWLVWTARRRAYFAGTPLGPPGGPPSGGMFSPALEKPPPAPRDRYPLPGDESKVEVPDDGPDGPPQRIVRPDVPPLTGISAAADAGARQAKIIEPTGRSPLPEPFVMTEEALETQEAPKDALTPPAEADAAHERTAGAFAWRPATEENAPALPPVPSLPATSIPEFAGPLNEPAPPPATTPEEDPEIQQRLEDAEVEDDRTRALRRPQSPETDAPVPKPGSPDDHGRVE